MSSIAIDRWLTSGAEKYKVEGSKKKVNKHCFGENITQPIKYGII